MFAMDMPELPPPQAPVVIVQQGEATRSGTERGGAILQPDYILTVCQETELTLNPESAIRGVDPIGMVAVNVGNREGRGIDYDTQAAAKLLVLEPTKHGKLHQRVTPKGHVYFMYEAQEGYIGPDRAVFMVTLEGRHYKTIVNLKVLEIVDEKSPQCGRATLVKATKKSTG